MKNETKVSEAGCVANVKTENSSEAKCKEEEHGNLGGSSPGAADSHSNNDDWDSKSGTV